MTMRKNDVKVLSEIEHVLHRPGMYVGDTTVGSHNKWVMRDGSIVQEKVKIVPAFLKLFDEVISNSIDEGFRTDFKFANEIIKNCTLEHEQPTRIWRVIIIIDFFNFLEFL